MHTKTSLLRACKKIIISEGLTIKERHLVHNPALSSYTKVGEHVYISVDMHRDSVVSSVIHEFLHILLDPDLAKFSKDLGEEVISVFERSLFDRIRKSPKQMLWWRKAIERRLR